MGVDDISVCFLQSPGVVFHDVEVVGVALEGGGGGFDFQPTVRWGCHIAVFVEEETFREAVVSKETLGVKVGFVGGGEVFQGDGGDPLPSVADVILRIYQLNVPHRFPPLPVPIHQYLPLSRKPPSSPQSSVHLQKCQLYIQ